MLGRAKDCLLWVDAVEKGLDPIVVPLDAEFVDTSPGQSHVANVATLFSRCPDEVEKLKGEFPS